MFGSLFLVGVLFSYFIFIDNEDYTTSVLFSKVIGSMIICASCIMEVPQVVKIVKA